MAAQLRYYMSRVIKRGELSTEKVIESIREPATVEYRGTRYSFTDAQFVNVGSIEGVYAKLARYQQQGAVEIVREDEHASAEAKVKNLIDVSSPFVYLPEFSGLAYRHIWNILPRERFEKIFKEIVEKKYDGFFVGCDIEPIADLRTFLYRLSKLDRITEISATVAPPNPLFSPCWKPLSDYLKRRDLEEIKITEQSRDGINTKVKEIAEVVLMPDRKQEEIEKMMEPLLSGVGDAALLMAADGYGTARVVGTENERDITVRTSENQKSFLIDRDAPPEQFLEEAIRAFDNVSKERRLEHP